MASSIAVEFAILLSVGASYSLSSLVGKRQFSLLDSGRFENDHDGTSRDEIMWRLSRIAGLILFPWLIGAAEPGRVEFSVRDRQTQEIVPCRIHLQDANGKPVKPAGLTLPFWKDHFACEGTAEIEIPAGEYRYEIDRGPEYATIRKPLTVAGAAVPRVEETLTRIADLAREKWWSGETHIHRPLADVPLLMRAEDLHVGVVMTWWNDRNPWKDVPLPELPVTVFDGYRMYDALGGEDERGGGALLMSGLKKPLPIAGSKSESPPSVKWLLAAKGAGAWVDAEKPFWWDFPVWLSAGRLDSVGLANNHMNRAGMYAGGEAWGRPRDRDLFPEPLGNGYWTQAIYYHALNAGFRLPPSAGSASGVLPNPVGYNRMYAYVDGELTWGNWWSAVRAGRVFVTNGPLLRLTASGQSPGSVFQSENPLQVVIDGRLDSRDPIAAIELVQNGRVERLSGFPAKVTLRESGWFLVRVRADVPQTFRFASTGPWYVEIGGSQPAIERESCEFFRQWTEERIDALRQTLTSDEERREVLPAFEAASRFWAERAAQGR
ncbi:MAG TPA: hypothetical protein VL475_06135 [Planctomycetaceae bacterium]|nr:hypothetical protein [Planctomycetaceae bacterium]